MANLTEPQTQVWRFIEDNEWEGERWKVWFEAPIELEGKLEELKVHLQKYNPDSYRLKQVDDFPEFFDDGSMEECEYADELEDGEECGDCEYCGGAEGYYPAESQQELNVDVLELALEYYRAEAWNHGNGGDDPLYKLGLFNS